MKKYLKLTENHQFLFTPVEMMSCNSSLEPPGPWFFFKKSANRILAHGQKIIELYCIEFADCFTKKSCTRGYFHPPDDTTREKFKIEHKEEVGRKVNHSVHPYFLDNRYCMQVNIENSEISFLQFVETKNVLVLNYYFEKGK